MSVIAPSLWDFSVSLYSREGMEPLCLKLQDERDINVNTLLWGLWLDKQSKPFDETLWRAGLNRIDQWHRCRVKPLRSMRRKIPKRWPWLLLREKVKQWELQAEATELGYLQSVTDSWPCTEGVNPCERAEFAYTALLITVGDPVWGSLRQIVKS